MQEQRLPRLDRCGLCAQGEIEKTGELVDVERPSPPKKRRKAKAEKALDEEVPKEAAVEAKPKKAKRLREQGAALEGQEVKKVKKKVNKAEKAAAPGQEGPGLQTAADAPPSAAPVPATNVNTDGALSLHSKLFRCCNVRHHHDIARVPAYNAVSDMQVPALHMSLLHNLMSLRQHRLRNRV